MNRMNGKLKIWLIITLCAAIIAFSLPFITTTFKAGSDKPVVILLDPGHGGPDFGACNTAKGLYEADLNLSISMACYNELQRYDGVEVYITHTGLDPKGKKMTLNERCRMAKKVGADILISLHCNDADSATANGAEVFVSHSTYKYEYNEKSSALAVCFLKQFKDMGFGIRGVLTRLSNGSRQYHHPDGTQEVGDYYAVIGDTIKYYGIPGILVEHGFIKGDSEMFDSEEKLQRLGIADATAIAEFYGLKLKDGSETPYETDQNIIYLTDNERQEVMDVEKYVLGLPQQITLDNEYNVEEAVERFEALSDDQKAALDSKVSEYLYESALQLEYLRHPVRLEVIHDEDAFINRFNYTASGFVSATDGITAQDVMKCFEVTFDMNALLINEKFIAEEQLLSEYAEEGITPTEEEIAALAQENVNEYLLNGDFEIVMVDENGERISGDELVGTGCCILVMANGTEADRVAVVISGDISGDGVVDSLDYLRLRRYLSGVSDMSGTDLMAADYNCDGDVNSDDEAAMKEYIAGK